MVFRVQCRECGWHTSTGSNRDETYVNSVADAHKNLYGHDIARYEEESE